LIRAPGWAFNRAHSRLDIAREAAITDGIHSENRHEHSLNASFGHRSRSFDYARPAKRVKSGHPRRSSDRHQSGCENQQRKAFSGPRFEAAADPCDDSLIRSDNS
jgi:hypothetical protein